MIRFQILFTAILIIFLISPVVILAQGKYTGGDADGYAGSTFYTVNMLVNIEKYNGGEGGGYTASVPYMVSMLVNINKYNGGDSDGYASVSCDHDPTDPAKFTGGDGDGYVSSTLYLVSMLVNVINLMVELRMVLPVLPMIMIRLIRRSMLAVQQMVMPAVRCILSICWSMRTNIQVATQMVMPVLIIL
jgi:hypothetical protein